MHFLPDVKVWNTGNTYQDAASLCLDNNLMWAAAINAVLSIEIYLKSFLSKQVLVEVFGGIAKQGFSEPPKGHDLRVLFQKIAPRHQELLIQESKLLSEKLDLLQEIEKYKDVFFHARYYHEPTAIQMVDSEVVHLSKHMRELVIKVAKHTHPQIHKA